MDKIGYNGQLATQSLATQHGIALLFIGVTCMCLLLSIICMMTNPRHGASVGNCSHRCL